MEVTSYRLNSIMYVFAGFVCSIVIWMTFALLSGTKKTETRIITYHIPLSDKDIVNIKKSVINGSVENYKNLKKIFQRNRYKEELLYYSMIMASRYDYIPANYDVYKSLSDFFANNNLGQLDDETYRLAVSYLEYGANKGDTLAIKEMLKIKDK